MTTSLLKSFIEAVNPVAGKAGKKAQDPQGCKTERKNPWSQVGQAAPQAEPSSK